MTNIENWLKEYKNIYVCATYFKEEEKTFAVHYSSNEFIEEANEQWFWEEYAYWKSIEDAINAFANKYNIKSITSKEYNDSKYKKS